MMNIKYHTNFDKSQSELQEIATKIRTNCKLYSIEYSDNFCTTTYKQDSLGIIYYIKDDYGYITEIWETRNS